MTRVWLELHDIALINLLAAKCNWQCYWSLLDYSESIRRQRLCKSERHKYSSEVPLRSHMSWGDKMFLHRISAGSFTWYIWVYIWFHSVYKREIMKVLTYIYTIKYIGNTHRWTVLVSHYWENPRNNFIQLDLVSINTNYKSNKISISNQ